MKVFLERVRSFLDRHRRPVRFAVVFGALFLAAMPISALIPRSAEIPYYLGEDHLQVTELALAYVPVGGDSARTLRVRFEDGAPQRYLHHVELAPGRYEVHARVTGTSVAYAVTRFVDIPLPRDQADIELFERSIFGF